jgi:8-oxo-dGTP pyrophosphatase MutT (NUDIX family)
MKTIHKIAAVVIQDNKFFMVRKVGRDIWTSLGGRPEPGETEEQALLREIQEEVHTDAEIIKKIGDFEAKAAHDDAMVRISAYQVKLTGDIRLDDPELEECRFLGKSWEAEGVKLPDSIKDQVIPYCVKEGLLDW